MNTVKLEFSLPVNRRVEFITGWLWMFGESQNGQNGDSVVVTFMTSGIRPDNPHLQTTQTHRDEIERYFGGTVNITMVSPQEQVLQFTTVVPGATITDPLHLLTKIRSSLNHCLARANESLRLQEAEARKQVDCTL